MDSDETERVQWQQAVFDRHMKRCEAGWSAGVALALAEAITICRIYGQPPPEWVDAAVPVAIKAGQSEDETRRRYQDMLHFARWDAVTDARDRHSEFTEWGDKRSLWKNVFAAVAERLRGTKAACGKDQVAKSFKLVQKAMDSGQGGRFFQPTYHHLRVPAGVAAARKAQEDK